MSTDDEKVQLTAKAAVRLLKSNIRKHVYQAKIAEGDTDNERWSGMLLLEESFAKPALKEWHDALTLWDVADLGDQRVLLVLLSDQFSIAASEVLSAYDPGQHASMRKLIEDYHRNLPVSKLLGKDES